ncbi:unnamed protein product, partial [Vitis vinifera]
MPIAHLLKRSTWLAHTIDQFSFFYMDSQSLYNAILSLSQIDIVFPVKDTRRDTEKRGSLEVSLLSILELRAIVDMQCFKRGEMLKTHFCQGLEVWASINL